MQDELPEKRSRRAPVEVTVAAAVLESDGRFLLVRRREGRLMGRMWEVPQTSLESKGLEDLVPELLRLHGLQVVTGPLLSRGRHAITFRRIRIEAYRARLRRRPPADPERYRWVTPAELEGLPISSLTRKVISGATRPQMPLPLETD
jgi:adenine-specific DNA glycosylase